MRQGLSCLLSRLIISKLLVQLVGMGAGGGGVFSPDHLWLYDQGSHHDEL